MMSLKIESWQHSVSVPADEEGAEPSSPKVDGFASRLSRAASELFEITLRHAQRRTSKPVFRALQRQYGVFLLWCDGYGAVAGDLDDVLAESRRLRNSTHRLLVGLCQTLADKLVGVLLPGLDDAAQRKLTEKSARVRAVVETMTFAIPDADGSDSDTDSSDFEADPESVSSSSEDISIGEIIEDIETDIQCLVDLGPRYREPIRDKAVVEEAARPKPVTTWDPAELLTSRIRHRYPKADPKLAHSLGQANWDRIQRLYAEKERNSREAQQPATTNPASVSMPPGTIVASDFHDSGLGTSMATPSSYAETIMSYHDTKGGSIKIPPVPTEAMQGNPFTCDICGRECRLPSANWKSFWKKHVLSDLQPYICVFTTCPFSTVPFTSRASWMQHLDLEHGFAKPSESFMCPLCQEGHTGGGKSHMARHLEEISLTIIPANAGTDESSGEEEELSEPDDGSVSESDQLDPLSFGQPPFQTRGKSIPSTQHTQLNSMDSSLPSGLNVPVVTHKYTNRDTDIASRFDTNLRKEVRRMAAIIHAIKHRYNQPEELYQKGHTSEGKFNTARHLEDVPLTVVPTNVGPDENSRGGEEVNQLYDGPDPQSVAATGAMFGPLPDATRSHHLELDDGSVPQSQELRQEGHTSEGEFHIARYFDWVPLTVVPANAGTGENSGQGKEINGPDDGSASQSDKELLPPKSEPSSLDPPSTSHGIHLSTGSPK